MRRGKVDMFHGAFEGTVHQSRADYERDKLLGMWAEFGDTEHWWVCQETDRI